MMPKNKTARTIGLVIVLLALGLGLGWQLTTSSQSQVKFEGERAYQDVLAQVDLGPRSPGSPGHSAVIEYIEAELISAGWIVERQPFERLGHAGTNILAKSGSGRPWIILGAHFDTRQVADQDLEWTNQTDAVLGANDGASGVAVLLELARVLPVQNDCQVWLVFFDLEDQGDLDGWDWILGSRAFVDSLTEVPDAAVIVDMIGDSDLTIYQERNSDANLTAQIWGAADQLGYGSQIIAQPKFSMLDDHTPFLERGIPAVDMIDFDYPYWHTTADTADKVSAQSLQIVGETLLTWLNTME